MQNKSCHPGPRAAAVKNSNDDNPAKGLNKFECHVTVAGHDVVRWMANKDVLIVNADSIRCGCFSYARRTDSW